MRKLKDKKENNWRQKITYFPENFWGSAIYFLGTFVGVGEVANKEKRKMQFLPVLDILYVAHSRLLSTLLFILGGWPSQTTWLHAYALWGPGWFLSAVTLIGDWRQGGSIGSPGHLLPFSPSCKSCFKIHLHPFTEYSYKGSFPSYLGFPGGNSFIPL